MQEVEIPFKIASNQKWISGISSETTCKDILVAVLKSENFLTSEDQQNVHHKFALVETWRQVSKVLSPNSLIAKIWLAWGEEQQNVVFTVKRIKTERREAGQDSPASLQTGQECQRPRKSVKRRNSKATTGKQPVDTVHPRALNRSKQVMCKEIQHQMKKIISQGEIIRKHLEIIKDSEHSGESAEQLVPAQHNDNTRDQHYPPKHCSEGSDSALNDSFLELSSPRNIQNSDQPRLPQSQPPPAPPLDLSDPVSPVSPVSPSQPALSDRTPPPPPSPAAPAASSPATPTPAGPATPGGGSAPECGEDSESVVLLLENIHRINCLLESKEEQVLSLTSTLEVLGDSGQAEATDQVINCFDSETARLRDNNARLLQEIQENSDHIADMVRNTDIRKKMISQLELDVNIIERESKRLQCDLSTIQSIGEQIPLQHSCDDQLSGPARPDQTSGLQQDLSKSKLEYGSDSSSDTGVCSLSSSEGDYSLSTLV